MNSSPAGADPIAQVFADAAHDLVGPINQVSSLMGLLLRKNPELSADPASAEILGHIQQAVTRMRTLADGLRTISRLLSDPMVMQPLEAGPLISSVLLNLQDRIAAANAEVSVAELPTITADSSRLMWLFEELIENALKFRGSAPAVIRIAAEPLGQDWLFSVRDRGPGFDPKVADHVFRIFRRLNPNAPPGSGVGLTICRQIIERHHGKMWIEPEPGRGTTVFFTLPPAPNGDE